MHSYFISNSAAKKGEGERVEPYSGESDKHYSAKQSAQCQQ